MIKTEDGQIVLPSIDQLQIIEHYSCSRLIEKMSGANLIFGSVTAKRRSVFDTVGYYDTNYKLIEDYPHNIKLLRNGIKIIPYDRIVIYYSPGGISDKNNIDSKYLNESDKIFKNEIYPFVKHKVLALYKYK